MKYKNYSFQNEQISQHALQSVCLQEETNDVGKKRYCIVPGAPTPAEIEELLSLEFLMLSLPMQRNINIDDVVALARVNEASIKDIHTVMSEMNLFDEVEPKSDTNAQTIAPKRH